MERDHGKGKKLSQVLESGVPKSHATADVRRSVDFQRIFFRPVRRGRQRGLPGVENRLAALLVLARFNCVEPFAKPGFFRPAPVAFDVGVVVSAFDNHSNNEFQQVAYQAQMVRISSRSGRRIACSEQKSSMRP